jgi:hypothetical protein
MLAGRTSVSRTDATEDDRFAWTAAGEELETGTTDGVAIGDCVFCSAGAHEIATATIASRLIRAELMMIAN